MGHLFLLQSEPLLVSDRDSVMRWMARRLLRAGLVSLVFGGFVRDTIINHEPANDLDVMVPDEVAVQMIHQDLSEALSETGIQIGPVESKGLARRISFDGPWAGLPIMLDMMVQGQATLFPGVDASASNLALDQTGQLKLRVQVQGLTLQQCIRHCRQRQFVFFYDFSVEPSRCVWRLKKFLDRRWTCLTVIPDDIARTLTDAQLAYYQPSRDVLTPTH